MAALQKGNDKEKWGEIKFNGGGLRVYSKSEIAGGRLEVKEFWDMSYNNIN